MEFGRNNHRKEALLLTAAEFKYIYKPIELNRGNCMHRTVYNYHPQEIGHCSPAKECYRSEKSYNFSESESADFYLTSTTSDGQVL